MMKIKRKLLLLLVFAPTLMLAQTPEDDIHFLNTIFKVKKEMHIKYTTMLNDICIYAIGMTENSTVHPSTTNIYWVERMIAVYNMLNDRAKYANLHFDRYTDYYNSPMYDYLDSIYDDEYISTLERIKFLYYEEPPLYEVIEKVEGISSSRELWSETTTQIRYTVRSSMNLRTKVMDFVIEVDDFSVIQFLKNN